MLFNVLLYSYIFRVTTTFLVFFCFFYPVYFVWHICETPFTAKLPSIVLFCLVAWGLWFIPCLSLALELIQIDFMIVRLLFCFIGPIKIPETSPSRGNSKQNRGYYRPSWQRGPGISRGGDAVTYTEAGGAAVFRIPDRNSAFSLTTRR